MNSEPVPAALVLLSAFTQDPSGSLSLDPELLEQSLDGFASALKGPNCEEATRQFFNIVGLLHERAGRLDLAQKIVVELDRRLGPEHLAKMNELVRDAAAAKAEGQAEKLDRAHDFAKTMGSEPQGEKVPEPKEKIDLQLPNTVKG